MTTREWKRAAWIAAAFLALYFLPTGSGRFQSGLVESVALARWYAREHVLLCLVPAFFIAGAIAVFVRQDAVIKYLGAGASKVVSYAVASVSGSILAVCSCTVLPLFAGIYRRGAGLGPATAFLYSGPAINVLAIILTARVLGLELGVARAVGAILFSIVIGLLMHVIFRSSPEDAAVPAAPAGAGGRPAWQDALFVAAMVGILVFANWSEPSSGGRVAGLVYHAKWTITALLAVAVAVMLVRWMRVQWWRMSVAALPAVAAAAWLPGQPAAVFAVGVLGLSVVAATSDGSGREWFRSSWEFAAQILPLLFAGVLVAGFFLGRPGHEGLVPSAWVGAIVGGNSIAANLFASVVGAFMYFATLTEVPILQGLLGAGMGKGPALALLLAGPALSLPNMLVIRSVLGTKKAVVFVSLVVAMATIAGLIFGVLAAA